MRSAAILALLACLDGVGPAADSLLLLTEDAPPLSELGADGKVGGVATDLITRALEERGIRHTILSLPWARAYHSALKQQGTCVYATARTSERSDMFKWIGPIGISEWVLFGRAADRAPASLEEVRGRRIGGYPGDSATRFLKNGGFDVDETAEDKLNLRKLQAGRIDYWVDSLEVGLHRIRAAQADKEIRPVLSFMEVPLFLACNPSVSDELVGALNETLTRLAPRTSTVAIENGALRP